MITDSQNSNNSDIISESNSQKSTESKINIAVEFRTARLWQNKGKIERAIAGYRKILAIDPTHWLSLVSIEELLVAKGEEKTAIALYRQALIRYNQIVQSYRFDRPIEPTAIEREEEIEKVIEKYRKALEEKPTHATILRSLEEVLTRKGDLETAIAIYRQAIERDPNNAEFHKHYLDLVVAEKGIESAFEYYELTREDEKSIEIGADDLLGCVVVRDEAPRLPYFLNYYREKGVNKFLIVDNRSTDGTLAYLLQQEDVYVWSSGKSFNQVNFGSVWFELLLRRYGIDRWCLTVDADELFYYPDCERKSIRQLCAELDGLQYRAYTAILLDMYSDRAIEDTRYKPGENFLEVCPYFDRQYYHRKFYKAGLYSNQTMYFGGVRERVFGTTGDYMLSKVPLLKYGRETVLIGGQHMTNLPESEIAKGSGCLLHFKYFSLFTDYVTGEVKRKEHYGGGYQYAEYFRTLSTNPALSLYDENHSVKLENSGQLVDLGIMRAEPEDSFDRAPRFPLIAPLPVQIARPFWSVMIPAPRQADELELTLRSVLEQAPNLEEMQIEVIDHSEAIAVEISAIVDRIGEGRVHFYRHPEAIEYPDLLNLCIQRARGRWVHLPRGGDRIEPGFYAALRSAIEREPSIGSAFCRFRSGEGSTLSDLEGGTPGILPRWLERIALDRRLSLPAVVVRRSVYETLGGFCPDAGSACDWEMWQRVALRYPVWYEPQPLASALKPERGDARAAIEIARTYLPLTTSGSLSERALENHALGSVRLAGQYLERGDCPATIANLLEAGRCSQSATVRGAIARLFLDVKTET